MSPPSTALDRLTDRAREAVGRARDEARRLGRSAIDAEHVVLGLVGDGSGLAAEVLRRVGVDPKDVRTEVARRSGETPLSEAGDDDDGDAELPLSATATRLLERARGEAERRASELIGVEHILLSILEDRDATVARVLSAAGVAFDRAKAEVISRIGGGGADGAADAGSAARPTPSPAASTDDPDGAAPTIVLGVSGSIAAYKAADLASKLAQAGLAVETVLTQSARRLVTEHTFHALTGRPVHTELFDPDATARVNHIDITDRAKLLVIAPATANLIARLALGLADDVLTTMALAIDCPVLLCPAMNHRMWSHPAVKKNLETLRGFGYRIIEPDAGHLACGHVGAGRLAEPEAIAAIVLETLGWSPPGA